MTDKWIYVFAAETVDKWKYCPACGTEILEVYPGDRFGHTTCMTDDCDGADFKVINETKQRTINAISEGTILTHRVGGAIGRCVKSGDKFAIAFRANDGTFGQTNTATKEIISNAWRLATDEEVRRYFDAD